MSVSTVVYTDTKESGLNYVHHVDTYIHTSLQVLPHFKDFNVYYQKTVSVWPNKLKY